MLDVRSVAPDQDGFPLVEQHPCPSLFDRVAHAAFLAALLVTPLLFSTRFAEVFQAPKAWWIEGLAILLAVAGLARLAMGGCLEIPRLPAVGFLALLAVWATLSLTWCASVPLALRDLDLHLATTVLCVAALTAVTDRAHIRLAVDAAVTGGALVAGLALLQAFGHDGLVFNGLASALHSQPPPQVGGAPATQGLILTLLDPVRVRALFDWLDPRVLILPEPPGEPLKIYSLLGHRSWVACYLAPLVPLALARFLGAVEEWRDDRHAQTQAVGIGVGAGRLHALTIGPAVALALLASPPWPTLRVAMPVFAILLMLGSRARPACFHAIASILMATTVVLTRSPSGWLALATGIALLTGILIARRTSGPSSTRPPGGTSLWSAGFIRNAGVSPLHPTRGRRPLDPVDSRSGINRVQGAVPPGGGVEAKPPLFGWRRLGPHFAAMHPPPGSRRGPGRAAIALPIVLGVALLAGRAGGMAGVGGGAGSMSWGGQVDSLLSALRRVAPAAAEEWRVRAEARWLMLRTSWAIITGSPRGCLVGTGVGCYPLLQMDAQGEILASTSGRTLIPWASRCDHAFNEFLHTWAELGFVGLALLLLATASFAAHTWMHLWRTRPGADGTLFAGMVAGVAAAGVHMLLGKCLHVAPSAVLLACLVAFALRFHPCPVARLTLRVPARCLMVLPFLAAACLLLRGQTDGLLAQHHWREARRLFELRRFDDAIADFRKALAHDGARGEILFDLGRALMDSGRDREAIETFARSTESLVDPATHVNLAICHVKVSASLEAAGRRGPAQEELALARDEVARALWYLPSNAVAHRWQQDIALKLEGRSSPPAAMARHPSPAAGARGAPAPGPGPGLDAVHLR